MRLHLDTTNNNVPADGVQNPAPSATGKTKGQAASGVETSTSADSSTGDRVAVSGASSAWSASFSDRAGRVAQLAAAVQDGTYRVASSAISQSVVASAFA